MLVIHYRVYFSSLEQKQQFLYNQYLQTILSPLFFHIINHESNCSVLILQLKQFDLKELIRIPKEVNDSSRNITENAIYIHFWPICMEKKLNIWLSESFRCLRINRKLCYIWKIIHKFFLQLLLLFFSQTAYLQLNSPSCPCQKFIYLILSNTVSLRKNMTTNEQLKIREHRIKTCKILLSNCACS